MKYLGLIIIFFSFQYVGYMIYVGKYNRAKRIEGLASLIRYIKQRSESFLEPLDEIYRSFYDKALYECGFLDELRSKNFSIAYDKFSSLFSFDDFTSTNIRVFALSLGKLPIKEHISSCEMIISEIEEKSAACIKSLPREKKLWCGIGALAGIFIIILLL